MELKAVKRQTINVARLVTVHVFMLRNQQTASLENGLYKN